MADCREKTIQVTVFFSVTCYNKYYQYLSNDLSEDLESRGTLDDWRGYKLSKQGRGTGASGTEGQVHATPTFSAGRDGQLHRFVRPTVPLRSH